MLPPPWAAKPDFQSPEWGCKLAFGFLKSSLGEAAGITRQLVRKEQTMSKFVTSLVNFVNNEDGPTAVEYAVMLALIIVVCIGAVQLLGTNANAKFSYVATTLGS
jgi:pilus assembly protein Flp/PilA